MKRYLISAGLIFTSMAYLIAQHLGADGGEHVVVAPPTPTSTDTSVGSSPTYSQTASATTSSDTTTASGSSSGGSQSGSTGTSSGSTGSTATGKYVDGSYTGSAADAFYGYVQVKAVVSGGKLTAVQILQYPNDRSTSRYINSQALPYLQQEAVAAQSASINTVSGASDTSQAFRESLASALTQAKS